MQNEVCELVVSVNIYSFLNKTIEFVFLRDTLDKIDNLTSKYKTKEQFFEDNKRYITSRVVYEFEREIGLSSISMELEENGVYILKGGRKISPLFKQIGEYRLEDVVAKYMYGGSLLTFYQCDKKRMNDEYTYESFFVSFDKSSKDRLEKGIVTSQDVSYILSGIMTSTRVFPLLRFLLIKTVDQKFSDLYKLFCESIPDMETVAPPIRENKTSVIYEYRYRPPYKDD